MISNKSAVDLKIIASSCGSLNVDVSVYSSVDLKMIASVLHPGATLIISNSDKKSVIDMKMIASAAGGTATVLFQ